MKIGPNEYHLPKPREILPALDFAHEKDPGRMQENGPTRTTAAMLTHHNRAKSQTHSGSHVFARESRTRPCR